MTTRFILLIGFLFLIDIYAFQAFKTAFSSITDKNKDLFFKIYWAISLLAFAAIIAAMFTSVDEWPKAFKVYLFAAIVIVYFAKLVIALFMIIDDVIRFFRWVFSFFFNKNTSAALDIKTN
jgi:DMSO/TMAO reductase YedYZ heme-binding membrane subunit